MMLKLNFYSFTNEIISNIITIVTYKSSKDERLMSSDIIIIKKIAILNISLFLRIC